MKTHNIGHTLAREVRVQRRKAGARIEGNVRAKGGRGKEVSLIEVPYP